MVLFIIGVIVGIGIGLIVGLVGYLLMPRDWPPDPDSVARQQYYDYEEDIDLYEENKNP
jgi:hypothetical protein